jgi:hypothetical protein
MLEERAMAEAIELTLIHEVVQGRYGAIAENHGSCCGPEEGCGDSANAVFLKAFFLSGMKAAR